VQTFTILAQLTSPRPSNQDKYKKLLPERTWIQRAGGNLDADPTGYSHGAGCWDFEKLKSKKGKTTTPAARDIRWVFCCSEERPSNVKKCRASSLNDRKPRGEDKVRQCAATEASRRFENQGFSHPNPAEKAPWVQAVLNRATGAAKGCGDTNAVYRQRRQGETRCPNCCDRRSQTERRGPGKRSRNCNSRRSTNVEDLPQHHQPKKCLLSRKKKTNKRRQERPEIKRSAPTQ